VRKLVVENDDADHDLSLHPLLISHRIRCRHSSPTIRRAVWVGACQNTKDLDIKENQENLSLRDLLSKLTYFSVVKSF